MNVKETKAFVTRQERLAAKIEFEKAKEELRRETIRIKEEERRKTAELKAELKSKSIESWGDQLTEVSDHAKANALEKISAMKNPRKTRREFNNEQTQKEKDSDKALMDFIAQCAEENKKNHTKEVIVNSEITNESNKEVN